jgi:acetolactate synthase-1/2/3 large subunit
MPMAMGAKIAQPDRPVFCVAGDGGFAHVWSELETCKREKINIVTAVINNGILGYQKHAERAMLGGLYTNACDFNNVDHAKIAEACGIKSIRIAEADEIAPALKEALAYDGSVVLDLIIDPDSIPPVPLMEGLENTSGIHAL